MKRSSAVAVAMLLFMGGAQADSAAGAGTNSCEQFAIQYRQNPELAALKFFSWAQRFMAASNASAIREAKVFRDLEGNAEAQMARFRGEP